MNLKSRSILLSAVWPAVASACLLGGCSSLPGGMPKGTTIQQARSGLIKPTGEYALPGGFTRLEYAEGAFGKQTFMLDFNPSGQLVDTQQVLGEEYFATIKPGQTEDEVHLRLGTPARVIPIGWQKSHVLNYRWFGGDCVWFQVSVDNATRQVTDTNVGPDPACDGPNTKD